MSMNKLLRAGLIVLGCLAVVVVGLYMAARFFPHKVPPQAWFDPRPNEHTPLVLSHQGGEEIRPSNTDVAFQESVRLGADVLDTDMHMTKDGVLVLNHDETVDRTTDGTGAVRDKTFAELQALDAAYDFSTDNGQTHPYRGMGLRILSLNQFLDQFKNIRYGIEIKQTTTEAAEKLCQTIQARHLENDMLISSFLEENMARFRERCPTVATSATPAEVKWFYIYHRVGLGGLYRAKFGSLQIPEYSGSIHLLTPELIETAHRKGIKVVPWTINTEVDMRRIIDLKVDGINTNNPDRLLNILNQM
jgi:glycerophosphoryl diester phosphodiesterase